MAISHILVPYDGSEPSRKAFQFGLDIAKKYVASITAVTCVLEDNFEPEVMSPEPSQYQKTQNATAASLISLVEFEAKEAGVKFNGVVLKTPSIVDGLLSYAENNRIDLIAMGSRGLGGFKKLMLGSVASGVSQYSKCPVLIIK